MNLVIGSTSQLSKYFPNDYCRMSSRNIDLDYLTQQSWDSVYLTFAEQRIYDSGIDYITPNYLYTLQIINSLLHNSKKIVCYTSCELWNELSGPISLTTEPKFSPITNEYILSKLLLWNKILELRKIDDAYNKVIFMHPFYFNSVHRSDYFLFGKIFKSILNREKITVGNLDFCRDMIHAKFLVTKSIEAESDMMVGSGKLVNVRTFIRDLYFLNGLDFTHFVQENVYSGQVGKNKLIMADVPWNYTYQDLVLDTQNELKHIMGK